MVHGSCARITSSARWQVRRLKRFYDRGSVSRRPVAGFAALCFAKVEVAAVGASSSTPPGDERAHRHSGSDSYTASLHPHALHYELTASARPATRHVTMSAECSTACQDSGLAIPADLRTNRGSEGA